MIWRALIFVLVATASFAVEPDEILDDAAMESRAREISKGLRCLVCQNESIDDSNAELARDLRVLVRERLVAGDTDSEVEKFVVDRFGEYVLLKPVFRAGNMVLWFAGPFLLLVGGGVAFSFIRRKGSTAGEELSDDEQERLAALLKD